VALAAETEDRCMTKEQELLSSRESGDTPRRGVALLIVDDSQDIRRLWRLRLSDAFPHIRIDEAPHGEAAVEAFERKRHAVVLMDCRMPVMDGPTAYGKIMELCAHRGWRPPTVILWSAGFQSPAPPSGLPSSPIFVDKSRDPEPLLKALTAYLAPAQTDSDER
jgi:two-component system, sensor histidine kinase and response regulator